MTTLSYEIHLRLMIRFHFILILRGASFESFSQILLSDTGAVLGRSYVECLDPHVTISVGYISDLLRIPMVLFSGYQGGSGTSNAILGHISLL